jgi:hypothetical protein
MTQETTSEDKRIDKKVIALAIICIILAASLVAVIALYQPNDSQSQLAEKDATINSLNAQIANLTQRLANVPNTASLTSEITYLQQQLDYLNATLTSLGADNAGYEQLVNLQLSGLLYDDTFTQDANTTTTVFSDQLDYAGYVTIQAQATANTTYAEVKYTFGDYNFDSNQTIGTSGTAVFPVLGTPSLPVTVNILIGNINQTNSNSVNATIAYCY